MILTLNIHTTLSSETLIDYIESQPIKRVGLFLYNVLDVLETSSQSFPFVFLLSDNVHVSELYVSAVT
jgi:hypothetical protein